MTPSSLAARDLMTAEVVSVPPDTPVSALARMLAERGFSAVPVTDKAGSLLGIVTEADLLRRVAAVDEKPVGWLRRLFANVNAEAENYARTHGRTAADIMTRDVVAAGPDDTAEHCARVMEEKRIKRLPVVKDGRLLGIVSRADLLHAALTVPARIGTADAGKDARIRAALRREMHEQPWAGSLYIFTDVKDGVVSLRGYVHSPDVRRAMKIMAERIDGVVRVEDEMEDAPAILPGEIV
jgi:CBS domain-containing protein